MRSKYLMKLMKFSNEINTRKVYAIGETVLDIIVRNENDISMCAGGSMLNTAVSLGRSGADVAFISDFGNDIVGGFVESFLRSNNVNTGLIKRYLGHTPLALAFLNDMREASYQFYRQPHAASSTFQVPDFVYGDIFLWGSFFALQERNINLLDSMITGDSARQCIKIYDPNFRKPHINELAQVIPTILHYISQADIIKASDEDLELIFNCRDFAEAASLEWFEGKILIFTAASRGVFIRSSNFEKHYPVPDITPISTIGAGDAFTAGIIRGIIRSGIFPGDLEKLNSRNWDYIIDSGIRYATEVCMSRENYVGPDFDGRLDLA